MPNPLRPILLALILAGTSAGLLGCGGDGGPAPSIPADNARTLLAKITEIRANVDVGSCLVASDKADDLIADVQALPSSVNGDVRRSLANGANQLKLLLSDPGECQSRTTTSETTTTPSTTRETTTTRTRPETTTETQPNTTTTPTQTQPTPTTGGSGGIGPSGL